MNWDCLGCRKLRAKNAQLRAERDLIDVNARSGRKAAAIVTAERDELLAALKGARQRCACVGLKGLDDCLSCQGDQALIARIEGGK